MSVLRSCVGHISIYMARHTTVFRSYSGHFCLMDMIRNRIPSFICKIHKNNKTVRYVDVFQTHIGKTDMCLFFLHISVYFNVITDIYMSLQPHIASLGHLSVFFYDRCTAVKKTQTDVPKTRYEAVMTYICLSKKKRSQLHIRH